MQVVALLRTMCQMHVPASAALLQTLTLGYMGDQRALEDALTELQRNVGQPQRGDGTFDTL